MCSSMWRWVKACVYVCVYVHICRVFKGVHVCMHVCALCCCFSVPQQSPTRTSSADCWLEPSFTYGHIISTVRVGSLSPWLAFSASDPVKYSNALLKKKCPLKQKVIVCLPVSGVLCFPYKHAPKGCALGAHKPP